MHGAVECLSHPRSLAQMVSFGLGQNLAAIAEGTNLAEGVTQLVGHLV